MKLRQMIWLLVTSLSVGSFMFSGCTQQTLDVQAQEEFATDVQAQKPAPNVQTPQREPDVVYVPTPNDVVS